MFAKVTVTEDNVYMSLSVSIEPYFVHSNGILSVLKIRKTTLVQGDSFKLGLKIVNTGQSPISNFNVKDIKIKSAVDQDVLHVFNHEYAAGTLNPNDEKILWISDFGTDMYGLASISLNIVPSNDQIIEASQINRFNSLELKHFTNHWMDFFYIKSSHEFVQEKTNTYLLWLAFATALVALLPFVNLHLENNQTRANIKICKEEEMTGVVTDTRTGVSISCEEYFKKLSF